MQDRIRQLMTRGVHIPNPESVDIGEEVALDRIADKGVVLYGGTKIYGKKTFIAAGVKLGYEAPVTVRDCWLGPGVEMKGGFFRSSIFLEGANMGSGAQVREGCILEEEANGGHTVGLKQTILFPFVTLGSLINFCDALIAGGTSRKNHSEVGSSYIHFNYTPHQDKATASLAGDVPSGVMLDQPPIFLGGQGGLVGPARIAYGTIIAAGVVFRGDCLEENRLWGSDGSVASPLPKPFRAGCYGPIQRRVANNINYLANLLALRQWYLHVRIPFLCQVKETAPLADGLLETLQTAIEERLSRFKALALKMENSVRLGEKFLPVAEQPALLKPQRALLRSWDAMESVFRDGAESEWFPTERNALLGALCALQEGGETSYVRLIQSLAPEARSNGMAWLRGVVDGIVARVMRVLSSSEACR